MKRTFQYLSAAVAIAAAITIRPAAMGQAVTQTTTTTSNGTISEFSPDSIVVHSETEAAPMHYTYSKETTIVDEAGNPVDVSVVKSGVPVQVYYEGTGEHMIARRIVVHRVHHTEEAVAPVVTEHKQTTTTTTESSH